MPETKKTTTPKTKIAMKTRTVHLFDAQGKVLGRLATEISLWLSGKGKVDFASHIDGGDTVVVINTDGVEVTGNKKTDKIYHHFSGYPGGVSSISFKDQRKKDSRKLVYAAVYGMLPKNSLRPRMLKRLRLFKNDEHNFKIDTTHA